MALIDLKNNVYNALDSIICKQFFIAVKYVLALGALENKTFEIKSEKQM